MKSLKDIKKFIQYNKKLGFDGYQSIKSYLREFSQEELNFLEVSFIIQKESSDRLMAFKDVIPLSVAIFAIITALIPSVIKENLVLFQELLIQFLIIFCVAFLIYLFLNNYPSKQIDTCRTALEIIKQIKDDELQEGDKTFIVKIKEII